MKNKLQNADNLTIEQTLSYLASIVSFNAKDLPLKSPNSTKMFSLLSAERSCAVVNCGSDWAVTASPTASAYCMSKGAILQMTKALGLEYADTNVRVNAVSPGDTFVKRWLSEKDAIKGCTSKHERGKISVEDLELRMRSSPGMPIGRTADPSEIAKAVLYLASDESSFCVGTSLFVDGGHTAR